MDVVTPKPIKVRDLDEPIHLHLTGDWHVGEHGCAEGRLRRAIQSIADDPRAVVLGMGDLGGFIAPDDRRWDPGAVADGLTIADLEDWGAILVERIVQIAAPIKGRIIGLLAGNHEWVYGRRHHCRITDQIGKGLGVPALGYSVLAQIRFVRGKHERSISLMATHGAGCAVTPGGKLNRLIRTMQSVDADLVAMGHVHTCASHHLARIAQDGDTIVERTQLGVITGTYLSTYSQGHSGYGERAGYPPVRLGHPVIGVVPSSGDLSVRWA